MKLQLLELYILHAPDPLLRDVGGTAQSKTRHQLVSFMNSKSIKQNDGTEVRLDFWTSDNLARIMVQRGMSRKPGGGGLLYYVDQVMDRSHGLHTVSNCRDSVDDILNLARAHMI